MDPVAGSIIVALISGLCVAIPTIISSRQVSRLMTYRVEQLERTVSTLSAKLDERRTDNMTVATRIDTLTIRIEVIEREIKELKHKINEARDE